MNAVFGNLIAENWNGLVKYDFSDIFRDFQPVTVASVDILDSSNTLAPSLSMELDEVTTPFGASVFEDVGFTKEVFYEPEAIIDTGTGGFALLGSEAPLTNQDFDTGKFSTLPMETMPEAPDPLSVETVYEVATIDFDLAMSKIMEGAAEAPAKAAPFEQVWEINPLTGFHMETLEDPSSELS